MKLRLYAGQTCWILTPDFLLPPVTASRYQPLVFRGFVEEDDLGFDAEALAELRDAIDASYYAMIPDPGPTLTRAPQPA